VRNKSFLIVMHCNVLVYITSLQLRFFVPYFTDLVIESLITKSAGDNQLGFVLL